MDHGFLQRTYRSAALVTGFVLVTLVGYAQYWAVWPVAAGALLSLMMLYGLDVLIRGVLTPQRAAQAKKVGRAGAGSLFLPVALVKYPLVALVVWAVVRWGELRQVAVFAGGFVLVHAVIGLRAASLLLLNRASEPRQRAMKTRKG